MLCRPGLITNIRHVLLCNKLLLCCLPGMAYIKPSNGPGSTHSVTAAIKKGVCSYRQMWSAMVPISQDCCFRFGFQMGNAFAVPVITIQRPQVCAGPSGYSQGEPSIEQVVL